MKNNSDLARQHITANSIEALEARIAPAKLLTLVDVNGDLITITTSKGADADLAAVVVTRAHWLGARRRAH